MGESPVRTARDLARRNGNCPQINTESIEPHEAALRRAEAARDLLHDVARGTWISGAWLAYHPNRAAVAEDDEYGVSIQLTTEQALRLAALLQAQPSGGREP
jgi:hypothetical protein